VDACSPQAIMPLAQIRKEDVRKLAKYYGLPNANKEESMGLCFVGERQKFSKFICTCSLDALARRVLSTPFPFAHIQPNTSPNRPCKGTLSTERAKSSVGTMDCGSLRWDRKPGCRGCSSRCLSRGNASGRADRISWSYRARASLRPFLPTPQGGS
jgi:hypothetical protein